MWYTKLLSVFVALLVASVAIVGAACCPPAEEEGALPTLHVGDHWVYKMTSDPYLYTWTVEVTGQETIDGRDCYVVDALIHPPVKGVVTDIRCWIQKDTFWVVKTQISGEYTGFSYIVSADYSIEGPPLFPLEVGKEVEITETSTITTTMLGETETEIERYTRTYNVEKIEDITVAAGTFRCFKVVTYDEYFDTWSTAWYSDKVKWYSDMMKIVGCVKTVNLTTGGTYEVQPYWVQ